MKAKSELIGDYESSAEMTEPRILSGVTTWNREVLKIKNTYAAFKAPVLKPVNTNVVPKEVSMVNVLGGTVRSISGFNTSAMVNIRPVPE